MNALQIFTHGLKASLHKPSSIFATILILIVPIMYPLFWLQAFWNPYANVENLPVAFVNEDSGVYGTGLLKQLHASTDVKWSFPDRKTADNGLKEKTYYAVFVIPENFSESILKAQTAKIETYVDSKNNFMATLLAAQIEKRLEEQLSFQIAQGVAEKLPGGEAVAAFVANPVDGVTTDINPVANTGTGFAPYFSSLALWIGALLISLVLSRRVDKKQFPNRNGISLTVGRYLFYALFGIVQAALLTAVIYMLGIDVQNGLLTFAAFAVSALTSIALVSTLISVFGMFGQMLSMFLLIFQLTASGGTFPTELTQGGLFMALHPIVPFTYSLNALRETISGIPVNDAVLSQSLAVQLAVAVGALAICAIVETLRDRKQPKLAAANA
ncbi:YhgE/Pip family protein [Lachnospiraceae bacterium ZAX-1]